MQVARSAPLPAARASSLDSGQVNPSKAGVEYIIQLGAHSTKHRALGVIARAQPYVLKASEDAEPWAQRVDLDGRTLFRARFQGFAGLDSARQACTRLKAVQFPCFAAAH